MLVLLEPPIPSSAHSVSARFAARFKRAGVECCYKRSGSASVLSALLKLRVPRALHIYYATVGQMLQSKAIGKLNCGDIVWCYINALSINPFDRYGFFQRIKSCGAKSVFVLIDDWFHVETYKDVAAHFVNDSDLTAAVTPNLLADVRQFHPNARSDLFEEPIDTDMVCPVPQTPPADSLPRIVWTGSKGNLLHLMKACNEILSSVYQRAPFVLRIVGAEGFVPRNTNFPIESIRYDMQHEGRDLSVGQFALAWSPASSYAERKGHYKIKTYMAAGLPVVTSPVGYSLDLVQHGVNGLYASSNEEWYDALVHLLSDPVKAQGMGESSRKLAVERYSYDALAPMYIETLRRHFPEATK